MTFAKLKEELNAIEPVSVVPETIASFKLEDEFTELTVNLLIEVGSYACVAACVLPADTQRWDRNQAIIGGHIVRLYKLISAMLDQTCQRRRETSFIFARLAFETIVNVRYLMKDKTSALFDSYVRYSMRHEKKLYDTIKANIQKRQGQELPIERRMLNSIERAARRSGVTMEDVTVQTPKKWGDKNLFERAKAVGLDEAYLAMFGGGSHSVHGNWMDLLEYNLEGDGAGFKPELRWHRPRPQYLLAVGLLSLEAIHFYFTSFGAEQIDVLVTDKLTDLWTRILAVDREHEKFLTRNMLD